MEFNNSKPWNQQVLAALEFLSDRRSQAVPAVLAVQFVRENLAVHRLQELQCDHQCRVDQLDQSVLEVQGLRVHQVHPIPTQIPSVKSSNKH